MLNGTVSLSGRFIYLLKTLQDLGYKNVTGSGWRRKEDPYVFDLFAGNRIHTTELLESPLKEGNHTLLKEFSRLYIGILNEYDLIASKLFRGTQVDFDDSLMLVKAKRKEMDLEHLERHYLELASHDVSEDRLKGNIACFMELLRQEGIYD
ncbi:MAG: hypothetical protein L3J03_06995 [Desulfobacterales bacterium]|nr:hypothetical protein [Desulfobacterales bacterium]